MSFILFFLNKSRNRESGWSGNRAPILHSVSEKSKVVRKALEFCAGRKEELKLKDPDVEFAWQLNSKVPSLRGCAMLGSAVGSKTLGAKVPTDLKWVEYLYKQRFWKATGLYGDVESSRESEPWLKVRSSHKTDQQGFNLIRAINHG